MSNVIGHATLNVVPSTKGFGSALNGDLGPLGESGGKHLGNSIGGSLKGVVGPLMAAAGAVAVGAFVGSAIKAAGSLEQSMGAIDTVFAGSQSQMHAWATGAATSVGLARDEYNGLATLIGSQLKNAGTPMDELAGKTNDLVIAGADMASMFGGTTKEAVEAISSALKGERDPIERYGVSLNEAKIKAKMAEQAMNGMTFASEEQAKAAATLALIMEQTADAQGNFAKESNTYEGVMQRLSASWDNVVASVGTGFLPIATAAGSVLLNMMPAVQGLADRFAAFAPVVQGVTEILFFGNYDGGLFAALDGVSEDSGIVDFLFDVREAVMAIFSGDWSTAGGIFAELIGEGAALRDSLIANVAEALPGILQGIVNMAPAILTAAVGAFTSLVTGLITVIPTLLTAVLGMLPSLITTILSMVPMLLTAGLQLFTGLIEAAVVALPLIVSALVDALPQIAEAIIGALPLIIEAGLKLFLGVIEGIVAAVPAILAAVMGILPSLVSTVLGMLPAIIDSALKLFLGLITGLLTALPQIIVAVLGMLPQFVSTIVGMIPGLIQAAIRLFKGIIEALPVVLPLIVDALVQMGPAFFNAIISLVPILFNAGKDIIRGLMDGIASLAGSIGRFFLSLLPGWIVGPFKAALGIHSPSRVFRDLGVNIGEGLLLGIKSMEGDVTDQANSLADAATAALSEVATAGVNVGGLSGDVRVTGADEAHGSGPTFVTHYHDHSTSQEDKTAKLTRAQDNLKASVAAGVWR
ncbi:tape measure protein [Microbacterium phage Honk]|uniref:Tape measure protein n=1 Tax=Microbacterium phage Honk TaxID=2836095 RepID=A0A8F3E659_9CAUD|nr:tape measure protein [Microbacterium phage Honk]